MSSDQQPSLIPPNAPVPDPPGAKLVAKIPIFLIGCGLLLYLIYNLYLEAVDWAGFPKGDTETPVPIVERLTHPLTHDHNGCLKCHEPPLMEETQRIISANKNLSPVTSPKGENDLDFFGDEKLQAPLDWPVQKDSQNSPRPLPGPFLGDDSCLKCHLENFGKEHRGHDFDPFKNCTMCHSPHNSIVAPLLKDSYATTCTQCHPLRLAF